MGTRVGLVVRIRVGREVGVPRLWRRVGTADGAGVGEALGRSDGSPDGAYDGDAVGSSIGLFDGSIVRLAEGMIVG